MQLLPPFIHRMLFAVALSCLFLQEQAFAQADTIDPQHIHLDTKLLQPGTRQYLVYFQRPDLKKMLWMSLWVREIEKTNLHDMQVFRIRQHWYGEDSSRYLESQSINSQSDFSPLYHAERRGDRTRAYNWSSKGIMADTTMGNAAAGFSLHFDRPNYNWNLDIETFEMLPLASGKTFIIQFYDAGLQPPAYVSYRVTGSEVLQTLDNKKLDCWKLYTEGDSPRGHYTQTFWISKMGHELLKEEDSMAGYFRYKVKLPGFAPDLQAGFAKQ